MRIFANFNEQTVNKKQPRQSMMERKKDPSFHKQATGVASLVAFFAL